MTETVERCPICRRQLGTNPPSVIGCCYVHLFKGRDEGTSSAHIFDCYARGIAIRDAELATLRERLPHLEEAARLLGLTNSFAVVGMPCSDAQAEAYEKAFRAWVKADDVARRQEDDFYREAGPGRPVDALLAHRQRNNDGSDGESVHATAKSSTPFDDKRALRAGYGIDEPNHHTCREDRAAAALVVTDAVLALYRKRSDISWESIEADLAEICSKYAQSGGGK